MSSSSSADTRPSLDVSEKKELLETLSCVRYVGLVMVAASTILLVFNSTGLQTWTRNLEGNTVTDRWVQEADAWHGVMGRLGFAAPKSALRQAMVETRELSWFGAFGGAPAHAEDEGVAAASYSDGFSDQD